MYVEGITAYVCITIVAPYKSKMSIMYFWHHETNFEKYFSWEIILVGTQRCFSVYWRLKNVVSTSCIYWDGSMYM